MRFEICAAATLLLANVMWKPVAPAKVEPALVLVEPAVAHVEHNADEAAKLAALWMAHNAGYHPPACDHYDPLAILDADVDPIPGREHVIGNRRYGVAMYSEHGVLIARMPPIGCAAANTGDQSLSLSSHERLIVRTRQLADDGEHLDAYILERSEDELRSILTVDLGGDRGARQVTGAMYFRGGELVVKYHGRQRIDGAWTAVDDHCTWELATRSVSCRTPAAEQTSRPE